MEKAKYGFDQEFGWHQGNIRVRGKRENIIRFLQEELVPVYLLENNQVEERPIHLENNVGGFEIILSRDPDTESYVYFKGSNRQCLDFGSDYEISAEMSEGKCINKEQVLFLPNYYGKWNVDSKFFKEKALEHKVDLRIYIWDTSKNWSNFMTWYRTGAVEEEAKKYSDWLWDAPRPHYGE